MTRSRPLRDLDHTARPEWLQSVSEEVLNRLIEKGERDPLRQADIAAIERDFVGIEYAGVDRGAAVTPARSTPAELT